MNQKYVILIIAVVLLAVLIFLVKTLQPKTLIALLNSQNESGQAGTATLINLDEGVRVLVTVFGGPQNFSQPLHIHEGTCEDLGPIKYPLNDLFNGNSATIIKDLIVADLAANLPLAINLHKSNQEFEIYTSCGNLIAP